MPTFKEAHNLLDLTLPLNKGDRGVDWDNAMEIPKDNWNARLLHLYSHSGTHMDAPSHFIPGGRSIDRIDLNKCIGPALLIDLGEVTDKFLIEPKHIDVYKNRICRGSRIIFKTCWSKYYGQPAFRDQCPRISLELADYLADLDINLIGVEPPSVADVHNQSELVSVHRAFLEKEIVIVEGLCNLDKIPQEEFTIMALPLPIIDGDGSPCRVVALI